MFLQTVVSVPLRAVKLYILTHGLIMSLFISQMFSLCRSCFSKSLSDLMKVSGSCNFKVNKKKKNPVGLECNHQPLLLCEVVTKCLFIRCDSVSSRVPDKTAWLAYEKGQHILISIDIVLMEN